MIGDSKASLDSFLVGSWLLQIKGSIFLETTVQ